MIPLLLLVGRVRPQMLPPLPPLPVSLWLTVEGPNGKNGMTGARWDPDLRPLPAGPPFKLRAGETPTIRWTVKNLSAKQTVRQVVVNFVVSHAAKPGSPPRKPGTLGDTIEHALGTDIGPGDTTTGEYRTPIEEKGEYVVALELLDPDGRLRQSCALELSVE